MIIQVDISAPTFLAHPHGSHMPPSHPTHLTLEKETSSFVSETKNSRGVGGGYGTKEN